MRQKLGQHFLHNVGAVSEVISALNTGAKLVIEVGPGKGALTKPLSEALLKTGGKIIAIEKDPELAAAAREWNLPNVEIIEGDILEVLPTINSKLKTLSYALVGNIPYYLTGFLFRIISELKNRPAQTIFMIQKEVAERIVVKPPEMNKLAASIQFWAEPKILKIISKKSFSPEPKIDSAIILLGAKIPATKTPAEIYYSAVRALFAQPRKTILNNLAATFGDSRKLATEKALLALKAANLSPELRPQNLSVADIEKISKALSQV